MIFKKGCIGSIRRLYRLDKQLNMVENVTTGPYENHVGCSPDKCGDSDLYRNNSINKLVLIEPQKERIVTCGNLYQV